MALSFLGHYATRQDRGLIEEKTLVYVYEKDEILGDATRTEECSGIHPGSQEVEEEEFIRNCR